jgi:hypothetical protein
MAAEMAFVPQKRRRAEGVSAAGPERSVSSTTMDTCITDGQRW